LANQHLSPDSRPFSSGSGDYEPGGSPRSAARKLSGALGGVPPRKPTGPRSMSSTSKSGGDQGRDDGTVRRANRGMLPSPCFSICTLTPL
jgi:hypothetical protein